MTAPVTESRLLDCLADACHRVRKGDPLGAQHVWFWTMTQAEHLAFDLFLVRTKDPLAWHAGSRERRFVERVRRMTTP